MCDRKSLTRLATYQMAAAMTSRASGAARVPGLTRSLGYTVTMSEIIEDPLFEPARNCWRVEHADRVAFLVDGAEYFAALAAAMERAEESILILGWDVNSRMLMRPDSPQVEEAVNAAEEEAADLGAMLDRLAAERPALHIHILVWDYAPIYLLERQLLPRFWLDWRRHGRVHAQVDSDHPPGASHHQKIVVVDNAVAFVGGLDLTINRWDTRAHRDEDRKPAKKRRRA